MVAHVAAADVVVVTVDGVVFGAVVIFDGVFVDVVLADVFVAPIVRISVDAVKLVQMNIRNLPKSYNSRFRERPRGSVLNHLRSDYCPKDEEHNFTHFHLL